MIKETYNGDNVVLVKDNPDFCGCDQCCMVNARGECLADVAEHPELDCTRSSTNEHWEKEKKPIV